MGNQIRQEIVRNYINAYNNFDIDGMLKDLHHEVRFENISNGKSNMTIHGIDEFRKQAEEAATLFKEMTQKILETNVLDDKVEVLIDYEAILARDFSDDMKAGDPIKLKGKSTFVFKEGKIIQIKDES
jgi:ketosteroid isomerase-like protein